MAIQSALRVLTVNPCAVLTQSHAERSHTQTRLASRESASAANSCIPPFKLDRSCLSAPAAGYGFVSFSDAVEGAKALREMDGKYIGNRPCKLRKSTWQVLDCCLALLCFLLGPSSWEWN